MRKNAFSDSNTGRSLSILETSREWTTSVSNVSTGAPFKTAARPPTRMKSIPPSCSARRVAISLPSGIQLANRQDVVHALFQKFDALGRREREHPADQREIHAVRAIIRQAVRLHLLVYRWRVELGIRHFSQPRDAASAYVKLRAARFRRRAVPVHHARRAVMGLTRVQFHHRSTLFLIESHTVLHQNDLAAFVAMPFGTRAWAEVEMRRLAIGVFR